jgi:hypothetical protein
MSASGGQPTESSAFVRFSGQRRLTDCIAKCLRFDPKRTQRDQNGYLLMLNSWRGLQSNGIRTLPMVLSSPPVRALKGKHEKSVQNGVVQKYNIQN